MRKFTFPSELENLSPAQLEQFHTWLDDFTYETVRQKLQAEFGIPISIRKLCQYNQRRELAEDLSVDDGNLSVRDLLDLLNAEELPYTDATLALITRKNFHYLVRQRDITVNKLLLCHRIATYRQTFDLNQRRIALSELRAARLYRPAAAKLSPSPDRTPLPSQASPQNSAAATPPESPCRSAAKPSPTAASFRPDPKPVPASGSQQPSRISTKSHDPVPLTNSEWTELLGSSNPKTQNQPVPFTLTSPLHNIISAPKSKPVESATLQKIKHLIPPNILPIAA